MKIEVRHSFARGRLIIEITDGNTTISSQENAIELRTMLIDILSDNFSETEILDAWDSLRDTVRAEIERECIR